MKLGPMRFEITKVRGCQFCHTFRGSRRGAIRRFFVSQHGYLVAHEKCLGRFLRRVVRFIEKRERDEQLRRAPEAILEV